MKKVASIMLLVCALVGIMSNSALAEENNLYRDSHYTIETNQVQKSLPNTIRISVQIDSKDHNKIKVWQVNEGLDPVDYASFTIYAYTGNMANPTIAKKIEERNLMPFISSYNPIYCKDWIMIRIGNIYGEDGGVSGTMPDMVFYRSDFGL